MIKSATNLSSNISIDNKNNVNSFKISDDNNGLSKTKTKGFKYNLSFIKN